MTFLGTGPMCRYATDLLPIFRLLVLPEFEDRLRLNDQVYASFVMYLFSLVQFCMRAMLVNCELADSHEI
jgi:hypothetical protein